MLKGSLIFLVAAGLPALIVPLAVGAPTATTPAADIVTVADGCDCGTCDAGCDCCDDGACTCDDCTCSCGCDADAGCDCGTCDAGCNCCDGGDCSCDDCTCSCAGGACCN